MDRRKKLMIIILILIVILLILSIFLIKQIENYNSTDYNTNTEFEQQIIYETSREMKEETNRNKYYAVSNIVKTYMRSINNLNKEEIEDSTTALYSILDKNYISEFNINEEYIKNKFNIYTYNEKVYIDNMYELEINASINIFIIYGTTINTQESFVLMVKTDSQNNTFSIFPDEYIQKYGYSNKSDANEINIDDSQIEKNNYNSFEYTNVSNEQMIIYYFEDIKNKVFEDNGLYNLLDKNYLEKKFENIDEFNIYLDKMKSEIMQRNIVNFQVNNYDGYNQYVLIDQKGDYYIVNETAVMQYTVILDTYTIDLPQFIEQYNNATDAEKVLMNIQKVFAAINDGDYNYVYNKLDNTFKQNNFPTLENFETYIKENLYENNSISYTNYQTNANLHIYEINIKNADVENSSVITKNFIMQLLDGTDFVMSFNV